MYVLIGCIGLFLYLVGMFVYRLVEDPIWDLGEYSMLVGLGIVCAVAWPVVVTVVTVGGLAYGVALGLVWLWCKVFRKPYPWA